MYVASRGISRIVGAGTSVSAKPKERRPLRERLYMPCMCSTCTGCLLGIVFLSGGAVMVVLGYFADNLSIKHTPTIQGNGTSEIVVTRDSYIFFWISSLTYVGPLLMSVGTFCIVIACVVVMETRDKVLEIVDVRKRALVQKKPDLYDLVLAEIQRHEERESLRGKPSLDRFNTTLYNYY